MSMSGTEIAIYPPMLRSMAADAIRVAEALETALTQAPVAVISADVTYVTDEMWSRATARYHEIRGLKGAKAAIARHLNLGQSAVSLWHRVPRHHVVRFLEKFGTADVSALLPKPVQHKPIKVEKPKAVAVPKTAPQKAAPVAPAAVKPAISKPGRPFAHDVAAVDPVIRDRANRMWPVLNLEPGFRTRCADVLGLERTSLRVWTGVPSHHAVEFVRVFSADYERLTKRDQGPTTPSSVSPQALQAESAGYRKLREARDIRKSLIASSAPSHEPIRSVSQPGSIVDGIWHRKCLKCQEPFTVRTPYVRLCENHRKDS